MADVFDSKLLAKVIRICRAGGVRAFSSPVFSFTLAPPPAEMQPDVPTQPEIDWGLYSTRSGEEK